MKPFREIGAGSISPTTPLRAAGRMRGVTLLEMMVTVSIGMIASGIFFMTLMPALKQVRISNAFNITLSTMRRAHDEAVAKRGVLLLTFTAPRTITVAQATGTATPWYNTTTISLPTDIGFTADSLLPNPGPDGFGTGSTAIDFAQGISGGSKTQIYFYPDGSARDVNSNLNNGVVYLERTGDLYSSRAITVWGATGRIRGFRIDKKPSSSATYWRQQ